MQVQPFYDPQCHKNLKVSIFVSAINSWRTTYITYITGIEGRYKRKYEISNYLVN